MSEWDMSNWTITNGEWIDCEQLINFAENFNQLLENYHDLSASHNNVQDEFASTDSWLGKEASTAKDLVGDVEKSILKDIIAVLDDEKQFIVDYVNSFAQDVNGSAEAKISVDFLNQLLEALWDVKDSYQSIATEIDDELSDIRHRFSKYGDVSSVDFSDTFDDFDKLCGNSYSPGVIQDTIDRFVEFEKVATNKLEEVCINEQIGVLTERISSLKRHGNVSVAVTSSKKTIKKIDSRNKMYKTLQAEYGFTDDEMEYLKKNYPDLLYTLYNARNASTRLEMRTYDKIKRVLNIELYNKPVWYGNPMNLNGISEQEQILARQLAKTTKVKWNQEMITQLWESCEDVYNQYGINLDPRLLLAVICAEGTGSFNTSSTNLAADGQNGVEKDYEKDLLKANNIILGKIVGYMYYHEEFESAIGLSNHIQGGGLLTYINYPTPIVRLNRETVDVGVYANDTNWSKNVENYYDKLAYDGATEDYSKYICSIDKVAIEPITKSIDMPEFAFIETQDGQDSNGNSNHTWRITAKKE